MLRRGNRCCGRRRRWDRAAPIGDLGGAVALLLVATLVPAPGASASNTLTAPVFVELLRSGVALTGVRVEGDLRLGRAVLSHPLTCHDCHFARRRDRGSRTHSSSRSISTARRSRERSISPGRRLKRGLSAHGAVFGGIVDLRGSQVTGRTDFSEATFLAPVLAGGGPRGTARGDGRVRRRRLLRQRRFSSRGLRASPTSRDRTSRRPWTSGWRASRATRSSPRAKPTRRRSRGRPSERSSDFSTFTFDRNATFEGRRVRRTGGLRAGDLHERRDVRTRTLRSGATFLAATFPQGAVIDSFNGVESEGNLNFASAIFARKADFENIVVRGHAVVRGRNLLSDAKWLYFRNASIGTFVMDVDSALVAVKHGKAPRSDPRSRADRVHRQDPRRPRAGERRALRRAGAQERRLLPSPPRARSRLLPHDRRVLRPPAPSAPRHSRAWRLW